MLEFYNRFLKSIGNSELIANDYKAYTQCHVVYREPGGLAENKDH